GDAVTAYAADPGGDRLDHGHQRKAEQHGPREPVAELGADLAIGRDAARIVVRSARHQSRPEAFQHCDGLQRRRRHVGFGGLGHVTLSCDQTAPPLRAATAIAISAEPPKIILMPTNNPTAQAAEPGSPANTMAARMRSMMPLTN